MCMIWQKTLWVHNSKITLVKNENYWQKDVVKLDKVEVYLVDNQKTVLELLTFAMNDCIEGRA